MLKHAELTKGRLNRFLGEFTAALYPASAPLTTLSVFSAPGRISYAEAMRGRYRPAREGEKFGPGWSTHWFRIAYTIPKAWKGREVALYFHSASEGCVWKDGVPLQGLTSYNIGPQEIRSHFVLTPKARGGETGSLYVEAAINGMFGLTDGGGGDGEHDQGHLRAARLVTRDRAVWDVLWDFVTIKEMAAHLPVDGPHQGPALAAANAMVNAITIGDPATYESARAIARRFLSARNGGRNHRVSAMGHAHIDTAWLWPIAETKRKCVRSFATAVRLMDAYPEYTFVCSQAQQLAWVRDLQPALYAKIQAKAKTGQFVPVGGTWIEPDCNLPSGESLVRQFLLGQRFFEREFGAPCREFWNPDVFGYSGALPQIMRGAGIRFFLTQKLSWNQFNKPTSSTFLWEGIDGSRVLTHFPPTDTYNGVATVEEVLKHYGNFKDKERATESIMLFGWGDGGGGPTEEMLERLRRLKNVAGLPEVTIRPPQEFFARCEADLTDPIVWAGELYFEMHRGTYTTQAANKRDNRRCEELLHDTEFLAALGHATRGAGYPQAELTRLWERVLLNQFHDIIPGSSIREVYEDSARDYAEVLGAATRLRAAAAKALLPATGKGSRVLALNTLGWPRREVGTVDGSPAFVEAPALGYAVTAPVRDTTAPVTVRRAKAGFVLENGLVIATFDAQGRLVSFFDKRHARETLSGRGNQFVLFDDLPVLFDAWDVDAYHLEKREPVGRAKTMRIVENGPLRATVELAMTINARASLVQRITLHAESPRLDFAVTADWREKNRFLKVEFPLALRSDHATYEIQFGHVRRPTHFNTSWDMARFEVCAHRWADLSEPGYGVALLNDSKYGYACHGNVLRLSLLRAPKTPDAHADMGEHRFRYALFPHAGGPQAGGVIPEAAAFNQPLQVFKTSSPARSVSFLSLDNPAVVPDTIKKAEDSDALIVRLHESHGGHQTAVLSCVGLTAARRVDLLERNPAPVPVSGGQITLALRPFEILTLEVTIS
ncbi:MAG: alpha-mannosidase [Chthoniobacterales bacterium]|nr:alpha-mannosidase [Chthoniobacterales bacterium]